MYRLSFLLCLALPFPARGEALPLVDEVNWKPFRHHCQELLAGLETLRAPLPAETMRGVRALLSKDPANPRLAARAIQQLLDPHCLIGVHINPESRVKATRGPRRAELAHGQAVFVLVKVHNQGGVTPPLAVASDQAILPGSKESDRWVEASIVNDKPFTRRLSGWPLEYRLLRLTARQVGKREATLSFDVGQGTQDLGFRAEVPILFTIRAR